MRNTTATTHKHIIAMPPSTPPTMAPVLTEEPFLEELESPAAAAAVEVDADVEDDGRSPDDEEIDDVD